MEHERYIREAIELAIRSGKNGNHTFGALLVHDGMIIATSENTEVTGIGYGHAEYNLVIKASQQFPEQVLQECTLYTSTAPCPRCTFAIFAVGIKRIVLSVSYIGFAQLLPKKRDVLTIDDIVIRLDLKDVEVIGPILEEEGLRAFEYWDGEYHPLDELLEAARKERQTSA